MGKDKPPAESKPTVKARKTKKPDKFFKRAEDNVKKPSA